MSDDKLELAANHAVAEIMANRQAFFGRGAAYATSPDTKHPNCWSDYGYPLDPNFKDFYTAYDRMPLGFAGVEVTVDKCWQTQPWIRVTEDKKSKYNEFENAFAEWANRLDLWTNLRTLDQRQRVGRYGGLMLIIKDDKRPSEPVSGILSPDDIVKTIPLYESQLEVNETYQDQNKPNYGLPKSYQYNENAIGDENDDTNASYIVHESRVIIWAEGSSGNSIYGRSALKAGLHNLLNLDKIGGAGGEGLWKNARTPMEISFNEGATVESVAQQIGCKPEELAKRVSEKLAKFNQGLDNNILAKGFKMTPITAQLPNPQHWLEDQKQQFAASVKTPLTILLGNQSGNQASAENGSTFDETCESRRNNEIARFIKRDLFGWLDRFQVFAKQKEIHVCWDSLLEPSLGERMDTVLKMADVIQKLMGTGIEFVNGDELRDAAGKDPMIEVDEEEEE